MKNYEIRNNTQFNSIEVYFNSKPESTILNNLKTLKMRWNSSKKCWYGFRTAEEIKAAIEGKTETKKAAKTTNTIINTDHLENIVKDCYGAEWAAKLRQELKNRGVKGFTVSKGKSGYTDSIKITIKFNNNDYRSLEEFIKRDQGDTFRNNIQCGQVYITNKFVSLDNLSAEEYEAIKKEFYKSILEREMKRGEDYCVRKPERKNYNFLTDEAFKKLEAVYMIANAAREVESDPYTDYYYTNYYLDIYYKCEGGEIRQSMTEAEAEQLKADQEAQEKAEAERLAELEKQIEADKKAAEAYRIKSQEERGKIEKYVIVKELKDSEAYYINNLSAGIGKECSKKELEETIEKYGYTINKARITKELYMNKDILDLFNNKYLEDFYFISGGGCWVDDNDQTKILYYDNCIALYNSDEELQAVIDPQGYNYSRYVYLKNSQTTSTKQNKTTIEQFLKVNGLNY